MPADERTGVLVVGGGPAGASAAWHLARLGVPVTVVDRARFPRDKVCAEYLSPQAARILDAMGVMPAIERTRPARLAGMRVRSPAGSVISGSFAGAHRFRGHCDRGLALRRTLLDAILLDAARSAGARIVERVRVTALAHGSDGTVTGVEGVSGSGAAWRASARLVVGADGLRTVVGRRAGLTRVARWPRRIALVTHFRDVAGMDEFGEMHVERGGYAGLARVGEELVNFSLVVPMRSGVRDPERFLHDWIAARPHLASRFARARRDGPVRVTGPFASSARTAWCRGVALVGDAADFFDPFTGEGVYAALRGGELLAPFAAAAARGATREECDAALRSYDAARRREFGGKWAVERTIGAVIGIPAAMNHAARALVRRRDMADLLVGVTGDLVPAREVLRIGYVARLLLFGL